MSSLKLPSKKKRSVKHYEAEHAGEKSVTIVEDTWQGSDYTQVYYEDGGSDVYFGGPCGPIYLDEFGNS